MIRAPHILTNLWAVKQQFCDPVHWQTKDTHAHIIIITEYLRNVFHYYPVPILYWSYLLGNNNKKVSFKITMWVGWLSMHTLNPTPLYILRCRAKTMPQRKYKWQEVLNLHPLEGSRGLNKFVLYISKMRETDFDMYL